MKIGRVVGTVVASQKDPSHQGAKILLVQLQDPGELDEGALVDEGVPVLALDSVDAGVGDRVLVVQEGWSAASAMDRAGAPIDAAIVGVVDEVQMA